MALVATNSQPSEKALNENVKSLYADVIIPPPAIREVIDKTATFVAKNGQEFETRMMREPNSRDRFGFLFPGHAYRAYYDVKVKEIQEGRVESVQPAIPEAVSSMWQKKKEKQERLLMIKSSADKDERGLSDSEDETQPGGETDHPLDKFAIRHPYIAPIDDDIIKLTAQFVAANGQAFLSGLTQRERSNPQFEFLRPHHPTYPYFTDLVTRYTKSINPSPELLRELRIIAGREDPPGKDGPVVSERDREERRIHYLAKRMQRRFKQEAEIEAKKKASEEAEAEERAAMAMIDWDDFAVVETITFTEADAHMALPAPIDYSKVTVFESEPPPPMPLVRVAEKPSVQPPVEKILAPEVVVPKVPLMTTATVDGESTRIILKADYVRKGKRGTTAGQMLKCPITGQLVAASEMTHHLKVLLIDSKWKAQRDDLLARAQKESAFTPEADVETNIANFVLKRPDLFGSVEDEILEHASNPLGITVAPPSARPGTIVLPIPGTGGDEPSTKKARFQL